MASRRERELARLRAERQAARRAAEAARRRRRNAVIASTVAVLAVVGVVAALVARNGGRDQTAASSAASPSASPSTSASMAESGAPGTCTYKPAGEPSRKVAPPPAEPVEGPVRATMTTDRGVVAFDLLTAEAPCAASSFVSLARQDFYDDTPCHRLTTSSIFVLQCGDPTGQGTGGPGYQYAEENLEGATYPRGTVAMAKSAAPGSTGSQFFLVYKDTQLPPQYTPVGKITQGLEVLDEVAKGGIEGGGGDGAPKTPVTIEDFTTAAA